MIANLKKFAEATNNELFDPEYKNGEWMIEAVETHETIEQFIESSSRWSERSAVKRGNIAGFPFVAWKSIQTAHGVSRRQMSVIDLGDVRFAIDADLTNY
jgi:hypothetical protein